MRIGKDNYIYYRLSPSLNEAKSSSLPGMLVEIIKRAMWELIPLTLMVGIVFVALVNFSDRVKRMFLPHAESMVAEKLANLEEKILPIQASLEALKQWNEKYRVLVDLPATENVQYFGSGGARSSHYVTSDNFVITREQKIGNIELAVNDWEKEIKILQKGMGEIEKKLLERKEQIKHLPTIGPVSGGLLSANFGYRIDPFIEKRVFHFGIDISVRRGTEVYATADGTVIEFRTKYLRDRGYGRYVLIDHGNGYRTRYAHLSTIFVQPGQKVKRWEVIGLSGDTGRSTGPHIHYEVIHNGKYRDPKDFILN